ncbi:MAG TPA: 3-phosphoshikimate 1-carboxyvinyltransferase [Candidatus Avacidaminococcus intestinavium]|uniref:3-phosphoshikimate 1-carboxyvinyltransferase n=1 Tax=Candidatus Avacidaminococcus intestinavium TaxID=2840684 RepID=A0A9D1SLJ8_9FIRM|nr:3-phosphoshikimate 1-carboxyvinyltransferase [Candidatus Avacidaminococcus intestinavium]
MTTIKISPQILQGSVQVPSSKSMGHREIICAALAKGVSVIDNISLSEDILATCSTLRALGSKIKEVESAYQGRTALLVHGGHLQAPTESLDCGESGSTLRFILPLTLLTGGAVVNGSGKLVSRPLQAYYDIFREHNIFYATAPDGTLPLTVRGQLKAGSFTLPGDISSQFVSGLLFALPLVDGDSEIVLTSPLESQSYVTLTLECLAKYGVMVEQEQYKRFRIRGGQQYQNKNSEVEGDFSQVAFWLAAGVLAGKIQCEGLNSVSPQGDKAIIALLTKMGGAIKWQTDQVAVAVQSTLHGTVIDASDCPDIIPILTVIAALSTGRTEIINAGRLRYKECDRLSAMRIELNKLGADITELSEGLVINGKAELQGGTVSAWNDHRIAMSLAIASIRCRQPVIIQGAESVNKSYPLFWQDFQKLGGKIETID